MLENIQLLERDLAPARRGCGAFPISREGREEPPRCLRSGRGIRQPVLEVMGRGTLPAKAGSRPGEVFFGQQAGLRSKVSCQQGPFWPRDLQGLFCSRLGPAMLPWGRGSRSSGAAMRLDGAALLSPGAAAVEMYKV